MEQEPISVFLGLSITGLGSVEMGHLDSPSPPVLQHHCTGKMREPWLGLDRREVLCSLPAPSLQLFNVVWLALPFIPGSLVFPKLGPT